MVDVLGCVMPGLELNRLINLEMKEIPRVSPYNGNMSVRGRPATDKC